MDTGSRLAIRALILGMRRAGQLGPHAVTVINDELRLAAREAREALYEPDADAIELLALEIRQDEQAEVPTLGLFGPRRSTGTGMPDLSSM